MWQYHDDFLSQIGTDLMALRWDAFQTVACFGRPLIAAPLPVPGPGLGLAWAVGSAALPAPLANPFRCGPLRRG